MQNIRSARRCIVLPRKRLRVYATSTLRALSAIWRETDFSVVFKVYRQDSKVDVRREAAWVLREQAVSESWRTLFDAFSVDELARHRQWACEIAEAFSGTEIMPLLSSSPSIPTATSE
jgi:hypothetical protein